MKAARNRPGKNKLANYSLQDFCYHIYMTTELRTSQLISFSDEKCFCWTIKLTLANFKQKILKSLFQKLLWKKEGLLFLISIPFSSIACRCYRSSDLNWKPWKGGGLHCSLDVLHWRYAPQKNIVQQWINWFSAVFESFSQRRLVCNFSYYGSYFRFNICDKLL